jgi:hypothetical protein
MGRLSAHVARRDAERAKLGPELLFGLDREPYCASIEWMPARTLSAIVNTGSLAGVNDDDAFVVVNAVVVSIR